MGRWKIPTKEQCKELQLRVIEHGKETKDKRKWGDFKDLFGRSGAWSHLGLDLLLNTSPDLVQQVERDTNAGYKMWDSLAMLLSASAEGHFAYIGDVKWIMNVAKAYLSMK